MAEKRRGREK
jgi:hypothetical protein